MGKSKTQSRPHPRARLPRILVVEANAGYRSVISHLVELAGGEFESVAEFEVARRQLDRSTRFDLVILGAQGMNAIERFLLGSVSARVARYAPCPVLVVR